VILTNCRSESYAQVLLPQTSIHPVRWPNSSAIQRDPFDLFSVTLRFEFRFRRIRRSGSRNCSPTLVAIGSNWQHSDSDSRFRFVNHYESTCRQVRFVLCQGRDDRRRHVIR
jgi:hypothetical protein